MRENLYCVVTTIDGYVYAGRPGEITLNPLTPIDERELFLEHVLVQQPDGNTYVLENNGIYIPGKYIVAIQVWDHESALSTLMSHLELVTPYATVSKIDTEVAVDEVASSSPEVENSTDQE